MPAEAPPRGGLGMLVVPIGVLVSAVDGTIVVLALPVIREDLKISLAAVTWVVVGYLLVVAVLATQLGRFGDLFGRVRMYQAGFVVFTIGTGGGSISPEAVSNVVNAPFTSSDDMNESFMTPDGAVTRCRPAKPRLRQAPGRSVVLGVSVAAMAIFAQQCHHPGRFDRLGVALCVLPALPLFALHRRVVQSPLPSSCRLVRVGEWLGRQLGGVEDPRTPALAAAHASTKPAGRHDDERSSRRLFRLRRIRPPQRHLLP